MRVYKLLRVRNDGSLGPLFINRTQRIPVGKWLEAEDHPTKGYAHRMGWHTCQEPVAPHLVMKDRIWCEAEIEDFEELVRPAIQGSKWYLSKRMMITKLLPHVAHEYHARGG